MKQEPDKELQETERALQEIEDTFGAKVLELLEELYKQEPDSWWRFLG